MIIIAKTSMEQFLLLDSLTEEEKLTNIVLANPWQSKNHRCNKAVYNTNWNQIVNFVNRNFPNRTEEQRRTITRILFDSKMKEFGWKGNV